MLLNNKHYYNLPPEERKNLWKHYKKVYPNMGYTDMVKHFNSEVENYQFGGRTDYFDSDVKKFVDGGKVTFSTDGEKHVVYKKESPTGMGKGKEGHIMVNHPTKDKGKWDTIDLTEKANAKTVAQGVAATKKWHRENPMEKYAIGGKTDKYVAERDATSTVKTPAITTKSNAFKEKVNKEDNFGKYAVDAAGLFFYPASVVGSAIDFYQGDNVGGVAGLVPFGKGFKVLKNIKMAGRGKTINKLNRGVDNLLMTHLGTQIYDTKSDLVDPLIKDKKAKGSLIEKYEDGGLTETNMDGDKTQPKVTTTTKPKTVLTAAEKQAKINKTRHDELRTAEKQLLATEAPAKKAKMHMLYSTTMAAENEYGYNPKAYDRSYTGSQMSVDPIVMQSLFEGKGEIDKETKKPRYIRQQRQNIDLMKKLNLFTTEDSLKAVKEKKDYYEAFRNKVQTNLDKDDAYTGLSLVKTIYNNEKALKNLPNPKDTLGYINLYIDKYNKKGAFKYQTRKELQQSILEKMRDETRRNQPKVVVKKPKK